MVSISINDSIINSESKMKEKIISKLIPECNYHKDDKDYFICISCGMSFCDKCKDYHKDHKTIEKKEIVKYSKDLKEKKEYLLNSLKEMDLIDITSDKEVFKEQRNLLSSKCDKLYEIVDNIKNKFNNLNLDFKENFNQIYPFILQYKDKIRHLYEESQKETTIRLEKNFMEFYFKYKNILFNSKKVNDQLIELKKKLEIFKDVLEDFSKRIENIDIQLKEQYSYIKEYKLDDFIINNDMPSTRLNKTVYFERALSESKLSKYASSTMTSAFGRMNLITLLSSPKEKKSFVKSVKSRFIENLMKKDSTNILQSNLNISNGKIDEISENSEFQDINLNILYNIEIKSTNLILFDKINKKLSKIKVDLKDCNFKKFWSYHSILNYKGIFYISGGYTTSKMFYKYNKNQKIFIKLENMPSGHSYHRLIGINNFVLAISGFKNKNVEKYNIENNKWSSLPSLQNSRSWPSCVCLDDKYIFLFGGLFDSIDSSLNNQIEKLDINKNNNDNKWEIFNINSDIKIPFYSGVVKINNEEFFLLGGKFDAKDNNIDECYNLSLKDKSIKKIDDVKLPNNDEFNGSLFIELGDNKFGQFSSIYNDYFYIVDINNKNIELIKFDN